LWLSALPNPSPEKVIRAFRFESVADDVLFVCGATLFHRSGHPLRKNRLTLYRFTLPKSEGYVSWEVTVDLGVVARVYNLPPFEADGWLASAQVGLGESRRPLDAGYLYSELTAAPDATLFLRNTKTGQRFEFNLADAVPGRELEARPTGARIEVLEKEKVWLQAKVIDKSTGKPTPVRLAFRSKEGRYIPPYGHRADINTGTFQDYGADLRLTTSSFSYVDGLFQVELPVGDVYLEMTKGFEYEPVRQKLAIRPDQRVLNLEISRFMDLRSKNWVTADTHVHYLSPSTAVLEGQAEGVNLINLLAAQWGDLFSNVGDLSHGPLTSKDGDTIVWVGTENRQHILGHLGLLGGNGTPVFPMSGDGPVEGYIGTPLWNNMAEWAEACRDREGLVVAAHFPYPAAELAADIVLGKIDAVELMTVNGDFSTMDEDFNSLRFQDWYRALNCGYRLPAVGGTDKMGAGTSVGASRAYAHLGEDDFSFANWAKAVRRGNTFVSSGPILLFQADGRVPGDEIRIGAGGGRIEVTVDMQSAIPVHRMDVIWNGKPVVTREERSGTGAMKLHETVSVSGPGWLAARCSSRYISAGMRVASHTSPVYVTVPGKELFSAPVASYLMTLIDGAETWVKSLATRPDEERFTRALKVFGEARKRLHQRMHEHGVPH
jgi:hypothetical protein